MKQESKMSLPWIQATDVFTNSNFFSVVKNLHSKIYILSFRMALESRWIKIGIFFWLLYVIKDIYPISDDASFIGIIRKNIIFKQIILDSISGWA